MSKMSTGRASIAAAIVFLLFFFFAPVRSRDGRTFQIDEALKTSQSHFLRLLARGDFSSPQWFLYNIDRTDSPGGKYLVGLSILLHGLPLPPAPSLAALEVDGNVPGVFPREVNKKYEQYLVPGRRATLVATALVAALLVWCALRLHGVIAAIGALLLFTFHDLTRGFGAIVVFDPFIAFGTIAVVLPLWALWRDPRRRHWPILAIVAGVICGITLGVRFNGGVCLLFAMIVLLIKRSRAALIALVIVVVTASVVFVALNPYYWATAPDMAAIPDELRANEILPIRIINRIQYQMRDLAGIINSLNDTPVPMRSVARRIRFFSITLVHGVAGTLLWIAVALGISLPILRRRIDSDLLFFWIWALVLTAVTTLWLPVAWQRYLLLTVAPLALIGGVGIAELVRGVIPSAEEREESPD